MEIYRLWERVHRDSSLLDRLGWSYEQEIATKRVQLDRLMDEYRRSTWHRFTDPEV
jgi:hypothetical protein